MGFRRARLLRLLVVLLLGGLLLLLVGCGVDTPQNTFAPEGDVAAKQRDLFNLALWPAIAIFIIVEGMLVFAVIRFRSRRGDALPKQVHGNTRLEIAWTIAPAILLLVIAVPMIKGIVDLGRDPEEGALQVRATGFQWNWQFEYLDPEYSDSEGNPLITVFGACRPVEDYKDLPESGCATLHIPVGREIDVTLRSIDILHSFWVPRLAGKLDVVPGRTNRFWFTATKAGTFSGQCAEFCGRGHADMRMLVIAESEEEFQAWISEQLAGQATEPGSEELAGVSQGE